MARFKEQAVGAERKEMLYNYALVLWAAGEERESMHWLAEFEKGLKEGTDDQDIAMVRLFRDYTEWQKGRVPEKSALTAYEGLLEKVHNANLKGVVENNLGFLRGALGAEQPHEQLKIIEETLSSEYKMTATQRSAILLNKLTLLLRKGRNP